MDNYVLYALIGAELFSLCHHLGLYLLPSSGQFRTMFSLPSSGPVCAALIRAVENYVLPSSGSWTGDRTVARTGGVGPVLGPDLGPVLGPLTGPAVGPVIGPVLGPVGSDLWGRTCARTGACCNAGKRHLGNALNRTPIHRNSIVQCHPHNTSDLSNTERCLKCSMGTT